MGSLSTPAVPGGVDSRMAWRIAIVVAFANGFGFGLAYTFGAFFDAMGEDLGAGRGATALIFAVTIFLFFGLGIISGPLADRYGPRRLVLVSAVLMGIGLVATSQVQVLWLGYLTYGVGVGVAAGLYVTPLTAAVGGWFVRSRALALGVTSAGNGLGTLILVPTADRFIEAHGWRTAYVILAAVGVPILLLAALLVRRPPIAPPPPARERLRVVAGTTALRLLTASGMLMSIGLFVAFAFIVPFAKDDGVSSQRAALLVGIVGATSVAGRIGISAFARRAGPVRLFQFCLALQPPAYLVWLLSGGNYGLLVLFALLLGVAYGGFVALGPVVTAHLFVVVGLGSVLGLLFLGAGVGGLIGPPVAGWLAEASDGHTLPIAVVIAVTTVSAVLTFLLPRDPLTVETASPA
jgi:MFS family permease